MCIGSFRVEDNLDTEYCKRVSLAGHLSCTSTGNIHTIKELCDPIIALRFSAAKSLNSRSFCNNSIVIRKST